MNDSTGDAETMEQQLADAPGGPTDADLDQIAADLDAVAAALDRLDDGTYWTDENTGRPIDDALLAEDPTRRHAD